MYFTEEIVYHEVRVSVVELRHQLEKLKARKLSSDEKKLFKGYALEFFQSRVGSGEPAEGR